MRAFSLPVASQHGRDLRRRLQTAIPASAEQAEREQPVSGPRAAKLDSSRDTAERNLATLGLVRHELGAQQAAGLPAVTDVPVRAQLEDKAGRARYFLPQ